MFDKSDKTLSTMRLLITILLIVIAVLSLALSIVYFTENLTMQGITYLVSAILYPIVGWVALSFCLACAADVKAILNKLYTQSNAPIAEYLSDNPTDSSAPVSPLYPAPFSDDLSAKLETYLKKETS